MQGGRARAGTVRMKRKKDGSSIKQGDCDCTIAVAINYLILRTIQRIIYYDDDDGHENRT